MELGFCRLLKITNVSRLFQVKMKDIRLLSSSLGHSNLGVEDIPPEVQRKRQADMPIELEVNPYEAPKPKCVLCTYNAKVDYKNVRLLSQFVSNFTGKVYGRHITGLCERQQKIVEKAVARARSSGLMPYYHKDPIYIGDPNLFDPENPFRPHKY